MADKKISALTAATTPLAGTEVLPIVQSGATVKVSVDNLTTGKAVTVGSLTDAGNLTFTGTGSRITGDTTSATITDRLALQDSKTNSQTIFSVFPNGTATQTQLQIYNSSSATNYVRANLFLDAGAVSFTQTINGTGAYLPFRFGLGASELMRIEPSGNVGINTVSPNASALLDVQSTTKGVRMPNMTTTQKNNIASPAAGLIVFDTTLAKLCVYAGSAWEIITSV
jgi:hypothetical protein